MNALTWTVIAIGYGVIVWGFVGLAKEGLDAAADRRKLREQEREYRREMQRLEHIDG